MVDRLALMEACLLRPLLLAGLMSLLVAGSAFAQIVDIPAMMDPATMKGPPTFAMVQYGHQFEADVDDGGTEYSRHNAIFGIGHRAALGENTSLLALGTYTLHGYNFSGGDGDGVGVGNPVLPSFNESKYYQWNEVHRMVLGALVAHDLNDRWRLIGGGVFRSWGENGADYGDSITGGLILGFNYERSENFSAGLLLGAFNRLEGGVGLLPVPTIYWRFAEDWIFHTGMVSVFDPGVGAEVGWQISETVTLGTGFAFQSRQFRLRDRARVAHPNRNRTDEGGIGSESEIPIFANLKWRPTKRSVIDLLAGVAVGGNLRVEDADGNRIKDHDYDPAPFIGMKAQLLF